jgi:hypothetical protein
MPKEDLQNGLLLSTSGIILRFSTKQNLSENVLIRDMQFTSRYLHQIK